jgi:iron complex outermembrane receptor protein
LRFAILVIFPLLAAPGFAQQNTTPPPQHQTVVVTGTYEPLSLEETDRSLTVLPARTAGPTLNTLVDLLQLDPSLDLQERAPGGVQSDLSIRGGTFGQTLVLLNGLRLNDVQSGHHDMDIPVPLDAVTRIEVLRGSGSTMYGSDAVGGVINVITAPPETPELRLRTSLGNYGINQQRASLAGSMGAVSEQVSFSRDFSSGFMPDRDYRNLQLFSGTQVRTALGTADVTLAYMDNPFGADQFYGNYPSWEDTKTWWAGWNQPLGRKTTASLAYRRHSDLFVLFRDQPQVYTNHHADESYQAAVRRTESLTATTNFYYGAEALHESIVSTNLGVHSRNRAGAYAALDLRALRRFSLSLAVREEVYRNFSAVFNPTIAGGVWVNSRLKLRASASRAFRVPSYTDLYYSDPGNLGNPNLRPERAWTYEGGMEFAPAAWVRGDIAVFGRQVRDGIDYYRTSLTGPWQALNIDNLRFDGVESSLRLALSRSQTLDLRYSWLLGVQSTIPGIYTKYTFNYPSDSGVVAWQGTLKRHWLLRSRAGVLNRRGRDPYGLWNIDAAYVGGRWHPFLQISNLTGTSYQEILGINMPGRTVIGGVEMLFARP